MNYYKALMLRAIKAVESPTGEDQYRAIMRWYSKNFHTPLHTVEELPTEDVLRTFYEQTYSEMPEEQRKEELKALLETEEETRQRLKVVDEERADIFQFAQLVQEEEKKKKAKSKTMADIKPQNSTKFADQRIPQATPTEVLALKDVTELPPDIEMKFVSEDEMNLELEDYSGMVRPGAGKQS